MKLVSPRQVEWIIKAANEFNKTLGKGDETCDIIADYCNFTVVNVSVCSQSSEYQGQRADL